MKWPKSINKKSKIKYAHITPLSLFKESNKINDMHLILYHWCKQSNKYSRIVKESKIYKILDNSYYELKNTPTNIQLINMAYKIKADEIVAPDKMFDYRQTKKLVYDFIVDVSSRFKIQAVVCGKTFEDFIDCFQWMNKQRGINVIAISRRGTPIDKQIWENCGKNFAEYRRRIANLLATISKKPIHLLGANHISDLMYNYHSRIRSIDTKLISKLIIGKKIDLKTNLNNKQIKKTFVVITKYIKQGDKTWVK